MTDTVRICLTETVLRWLTEMDRLLPVVYVNENENRIKAENLLIYSLINLSQIIFEKKKGFLFLKNIQAFLVRF